MKTQSGFTLIEALVTGVLSTIVAGTLVSVLSMVNQQISAGISENRLGRIQSVVSEQIRASARKSWGILQSGDQIDDKDPSHHYDKLNPVATTNEIIMGNKDGQPQAKYLIDNNGKLWEWHNGDPGDYYPFVIGEDTVRVDPNHLANSFFSLPQGRKSMKFQLAYTLAGKQLPLIAEQIQCRNLSN